MFEILYDTNFFIMSTFQWWILLVIREHIGRILELRLIRLV